jgi:beta-lactamase class A
MRRIAGRKSKLPLFILLLLGCLGVGLGIRKIAVSFTTTQLVSPLAESDPPTNTFSLFAQKNKDGSQLLQQITALTEAQKGVYSVYVFDIGKNTGFGINEQTIYTAASVNKVSILAALYYQAQKGEVDLDERVTVQDSDIQDYGTGILRYEGAGGVYSIKTLAQFMMTKSDNTAAYILSQHVGPAKIQQLLDSWGLIQTNMADNKTSNKDMAMLFTKMYRGQIANKALTAEMLGFMVSSDFENRLPALLPKEVKIYHKIGSEIGNIHDVGIIEAAHPYYIGVFSNDITDDTSAETTIAQISKLVFDFMSAQ